MSTLRNKQLMPTAELLEEIYGSLKTAEERVLSARAIEGPEMRLAQAVRHTIGAVSLLADLVDRELGCGMPMEHHYDEEAARRLLT